RTGEVSEVAVVLPIPAISLEVRGNLIILVLAKFQLFVQICIERANESAADGRFLRVVVGGFTDQVVGRAGKARVETPRCKAAVALQFLHELEELHAK